MSAATGAQLYSQGGLTFIASVVDGGKPSSIDGMFSLTLTWLSRSVGVTQLSGGNVVIHLKRQRVSWCRPRRSTVRGRSWDATTRSRGRAL